jgi:hypothetical protein
MKIMKILGLVLIGGAIVLIFAAVIVRSQINLFIGAIVCGIAGNILYWLGKPKYITDDEEPTQPPQDDKGSPSQPKAS